MPIIRRGGELILPVTLKPVTKFIVPAGGASEETELIADEGTGWEQSPVSWSEASYSSTSVPEFQQTDQVYDGTYSISTPLSAWGAISCAEWTGPTYSGPVTGGWEGIRCWVYTERSGSTDMQMWVIGEAGPTTFSDEYLIPAQSTWTLYDYVFADHSVDEDIERWHLAWNGGETDKIWFDKLEFYKAA